MLVGSYNSLLVFFSLIVAILASYTALDMAGRVTTAQGRASRWWLVGGACAMGIGIWSMHFVGMLAFSLPIPLGFDTAVTLLSLLIAIISSAFALWIVCQKTLPWLRLGLASVLMGIGIAGMHYTGMAAMRMVPAIRYVPSLFILSIVIAIVASGAALRVAFNLRLNLPKVRLWRVGASVVMGLAIAGMHYTGMAAAQFPSASVCGAAQGALSTGWLALLIIVVTLAVITIALIISVLDLRLESRTKEFSTNLRIAAIAFDSQESLMITDVNEVILRVNQAFTKSTGYTAEEAVGQTPRLLKSGHHDADFYRKMWESIHRTGKWQGEIWDKRKDGEIFPKLLTISSVKGDDGVITHYVGSRIDITERKIIEKKLERHSQLYATLSQCNKAIVHCTDKDTLFQQICHAAVQFGGMKMAWVGLVDQASKKVISVAQAGTGTEYLNDIQISINANDPTGRGSAGSSIRENRPIWCQDFQNDPTMAPWHQRGALHGWNAVASLPLCRNDLPIGALSVYAGEGNAFDELARDLLIEMATEISFALDILDRETERKQIEQVLHNEKIFSDALIRGLPDIFYLLDRQGGFLRWNHNFEELAGLSPEEMSAINALAFVHEEDRPYIAQKLQDAFELGVAEAEARLILKKGIRHYVLTATRVETQHGINVVGVGVDITERRRAEDELIESQTHLDLALRSADMGVWSSDLVANKRYFDDQTCRILGIDPATFTGTAKEFFHAIHPDDVEMLKAALARSIELHIPYGLEYRVVWPDGSIHYISSRARLERKEDGRTLRFIGVLWDITERKQTEATLLNKEAELTQFKYTLDHAQNGVFIFQSDTLRFIYVNHGTIQQVGYSKDELLRMTPLDIKPELTEQSFRAILKPLLDGSMAVKVFETIHRHKDGHDIPVEISLQLVQYGTQEPRFIAFSQDITERLAVQEKIQNLAFYDPLTGLPNRRLLTDRLQQAMVSSARNGLVGAILFIDLDNFKTINDTLGHACGDLLLQQAATRLTSCVREEDTVARIGGDEFVVILEYLSADKSEAAMQTESIGEKLLAVLSQTYQIAPHECHSTCSIGITLFNDRSQSTDELLKQADIAMYQAKKAGRNALRFFDTQMQEIVTTRATLEGELRKAIEKRQLHLCYQIQVDERRNPIGAEALIRWNHPKRGLVLPGQFIALAEETGLILPIGQWVLEAVCAQLKAWENEESTRKLVLAVNVSARQFRQPDFVAQVQATVQRHAIDPKRLKLELTESLLLENIESTVAIMNALNEIGVQFSLDDFGTGYFSLQYLKRLPLDQIKIDQSFVRDLAVDSGDRAIVRTIIAMAKSLNLDVIAEGVETEEQLQMLLNKGCTHYQGYLFGKPVPIEQFDKQFKQG